MRAPANRFYLERATKRFGKYCIERLTERETWEVAPPDPMGFGNLRKATDKAISLGVAKDSYVRGSQGGTYKIHFPLTKEQKQLRYEWKQKREHLDGNNT